MAYNAYDELVTGHPKIKYYWTLDNTPNATIGGINLTGTTTYDTGKVHAKCATFDGVSEELHSSANLILSGTDKISVSFWWYPTVFDTTAIEEVVGLTADAASTIGSFLVWTRGDAANDPLGVLLLGDVGSNAGFYYPATFGFGTPAWFHMVATYDKSKASGEVGLYVNGVLATPDAMPADNNNSGNFIDAVLYICSRGAANRFANHKIDGLAIFDTILTATEVNRLYASVNGVMPAASKNNLDLQPILKIG